METKNRKTKILFVITKSNFGGAQKYVYDLAINLPEDQFELVVALGGNGSLVKKLLEKNIRVVSIPSLARDMDTASDVSAFFELYSIFHNEKPNVVHLNSAKAGGVGALAARLARVQKIIFTAHGWAFNEDRPFGQRLIIKLFSWITVLLAHKTIAVSWAVKNNTRNWLFIRNKVVIIHNGVGSVNFLSRENARTHLATISGIVLPENTALIGTIAELHKNKGLTYAIEAFSLLSKKNVSLFFFILGNGEEKEQLDTLIEHYRIQERIFLLGFIENAADYLKAFDIFLLPSTKEGLPYVLLEAGLASLPVVASRVGGIPEVIEDGKTGILVPPREPVAISEAIKIFFESLVLRKKLGSALHEKVSSEFSLERMLTETTHLYLG